MISARIFSGGSFAAFKKIMISFSFFDRDLFLSVSSRISIRKTANNACSSSNLFHNTLQPIICTDLTPMFWRKIHVIEVISKVFKNVRKFLLRSVKWSVFGGYSVSSHAQPTIFSSSTILFQPNFAGLLKLPQDNVSSRHSSINFTIPSNFFATLSHSFCFRHRMTRTLSRNNYSRQYYRNYQ